jgi:hypothetical protein
VREPLLSFVGALIIALVAPLEAQDIATYCLPQSELFLARVELGASGDEVRALLHTPSREVKDSAMDDGGVYPLIHLYYPDLRVDLGRNAVELLQTSSPKVSLPSGGRVGMTLSEVARRLKLVNPAQYLSGSKLSPLTCEGGDGARHSPDTSGLELTFGPARVDSLRRVSKIRLIERGP